MIRVLLVHDICLFRWALSEVLGREDDIDVATTSSNEAAGRAKALRPDVCVVDADYTAPERLDALRKLSNSAGNGSRKSNSSRKAGGTWKGLRRTAVADRDGAAKQADPAGGAGEEEPAADDGPALLVLGTSGKPGPLRRAFEADALGYVDKEGSPEQLTTGIRQVAAGKRFIDGSLGFDFLQAAEMPLTQRELSVLSLAAEGATVSEIAGVLHLSNGTVRNYMSAITRKTGARNRVDAIRISQGAGWV